MFTKDKLLKIFIGILIVGLVATLLIFLIPKNEKLTVKASDVKICVDESFEISYTISDPFATINFDPENEEIIEKVAGTVNKFLAVSCGTTKVEVTASNKNEKVTCVCTVEVVSKTEDDNKTDNPSTPDDEKEETPTDPQKPVEPENPGTIDPKPTDPTDPDSNTDNHEDDSDKSFENKFTILNVEENVLHMDQDVQYITLNFDLYGLITDLKFECDAGISIDPIPGFSSFFKVTAYNSGKILLYDQGEFLGTIIIER